MTKPVFALLALAVLPLLLLLLPAAAAAYRAAALPPPPAARYAGATDILLVPCAAAGGGALKVPLPLPVPPVWRTDAVCRCCFGLGAWALCLSGVWPRSSSSSCAVMTTWAFTPPDMRFCTRACSCWISCAARPEEFIAALPCGVRQTRLRESKQKSKLPTSYSCSLLLLLVL